MNHFVQIPKRIIHGNIQPNSYFWIYYDLLSSSPLPKNTSWLQLQFNYLFLILPISGSILELLIGQNIWLMELIYTTSKDMTSTPINDFVRDQYYTTSISPFLGDH